MNPKTDSSNPVRVHISMTRLTTGLASSSSLVSNTASEWIFPSEYGPEKQHHQVQPQEQEHLFKWYGNRPFTVLPFVAYFQKLFRIVRNHPIQLLLDAPPHHVLFIDCPTEDRPSQGPRVAQEFGSNRPHEHSLNHVEGDVGDAEEFTGVGDGEANVGYGKSG